MTITGDYDEGNIFARILRGEIPAARIEQTDDTLAFMDAFPQAVGHCLVIHRRSKARNLLDVDAQDLAAIMATVRRVARAVNRALSPDGLMITQFNGAAAGQTVYHLHAHIIPRWQGRPLGRHGEGGMANPDDLARLAAQIAACLEP